MRHLFQYASIIMILGFGNGASAQSFDWHLKKNKNGISIYTRPAEHSKLNEFKGIVVLNTPVDALVKTLKDADNLTKWVPDCGTSKLVKIEGNDQYHYLVTKAPFPLLDRDSYIHFKYTTIDNGVKVDIEALPSYKPEKDGLVRVPYCKGYWQLEKQSDQQTKVTYQVSADPGGSIPAWLANTASVSTPFKTLKNLREYVK